MKPKTLRGVFEEMQKIREDELHNEYGDDPEVVHTRLWCLDHCLDILASLVEGMPEVELKKPNDIYIKEGEENVMAGMFVPSEKLMQCIPGLYLSPAELRAIADALEEQDET